MTSVCSTNLAGQFDADIIESSNVNTRERLQCDTRENLQCDTRELLQCDDEGDHYIRFERTQSHENSPVTQKYILIRSEQGNDGNPSRIPTDSSASQKVITMRRQFSDNGHESGIGSDSDSGNSAVFFESTLNVLNQTAAVYNVTDGTQVFYNRDSVFTSVPSPQIIKDFANSSMDRSLKQYADLATPLDMGLPYEVENQPSVNFHSPNNQSPILFLLGHSSEIIYHDSMLSLKNERRLTSENHASDINVSNIPPANSNPLRIFRDARRQLSFERSTSYNQPIRRQSQSPFKRSVSSDNRSNEIQYLSSPNVQEQEVRGYESHIHTDSSQGLAGKNHQIQLQSSVVDIQSQSSVVDSNNWLAQKNLAKHRQRVESENSLSSPTTETTPSYLLKQSVVGCSEQDMCYTPDQLRRQCESLQMRLSQDLNNSPALHHSTIINEYDDVTNDRSKVAAAIAAKKRFNKNKYTNTRATSTDVYYLREINNNEINFVHPGEKDNRSPLGLDKIYETPTRQLSGSGFVRKVAFDVDQPATLPRAVPRASTTTYVEISPGNSPKRESPRSFFNWKSGIAEAKRRWAEIGQHNKTREAVKAVEVFNTVVDTRPSLPIEDQQPRSPSTDLNRSLNNHDRIVDKLRIPVRPRKNRSATSSPNRGSTPNQIVRALSSRVAEPSLKPVVLDRQTSAPVGVTRSTSNENDQQSSSATKVTHKPPIPKSKNNGGHYFKNHSFFSKVAAKNKSKEDKDQDSINMAMTTEVEADHKVVEESSFITNKPNTDRAFVSVKIKEEGVAPPLPSDFTPCSRNESPVLSVTGRTLKTFQTFRGELQPIVWTEDTNLAQQNQEILDDMTINSINYTAESTEILKLHKNENRETGNIRHAAHEKDCEKRVGHKKSIISVSPITDDPSSKFSSLTLPKPSSKTSDLSPDAMAHPSKPRSVSYSENIRSDKSIHKRVKKRKVVTFDTSPTSVVAQSPTCEIPTTVDQHLAPYGITDCDQAVDNITKLMNMIDSGLVVTSPTRERTITAGEFNEARDAFKISSRTFVCDCRQLVTSAARTRTEFTASLKQSMSTFSALVDRSHRMISCLSAPTDKLALSEKVHDLADAFRFTIIAAWRVVGKRLDEAGCGGELKKEVSGLTGALGRLVHTLMNLDYKALVRRF